MFSAATDTFLRKAGWSPARHIDVEWYTSPIQGYGYEIFPIVRAFLTQFGGLKIDWEF